MEETIIYIGSKIAPTFTINQRDIRDLSTTKSCDLICEQLTIDEMEITFHSETSAATILGLTQDTCVLYYYGSKLVAKMYVYEIDRTAEFEYSMQCRSILSIMDEIPHYGGYLQNVSILNLIRSIFYTRSFVNLGSSALDLLKVNKNNISTTPTLLLNMATLKFDDEIQTMYFTGCCGASTKRQVLHDILFAYGLNFKMDANGDFRIGRIYKTEPFVINSDNIYQGGTIEKAPQVDYIELYSYLYAKGTEETVLFDNTDGAGAITEQSVISYDPCVSYTSTVNPTFQNNAFALLPAGYVGSLTGYSVKMTETILSKGSSNASTNKKKSFSGCTLVTSINASDLLDRLWQFYHRGNTINLSVIYEGESVGDFVKFIDPTGAEQTGVINSIKLTASHVIKAELEIYTDYEPYNAATYNSVRYMSTANLYAGSPFVGLYSKVDSHDLYNIFRLPLEVCNSEKIHVVLVSGGAGGSSGYAGADGEVPSHYRDQNGPTYGGDPGSPGAGGKIFEFDLSGDGIPPCTVLKIGEPGEGGDISYSNEESNTGYEGGATIFGGYSSDNGETYADGYNSVYFSSTQNIGKTGFKDGGSYAHAILAYPDLRSDRSRGGNSGVFKVVGDLQALEYSAEMTSTLYYRSSVNGYGKLSGTKAGEFNGTANSGLPGGAGYGGPGGDGGAANISGATARLGNGGNGGDSTAVPLSMDVELKKAETVLYFGTGGYGGFGGGAGGNSGSMLGATGYNVIDGTPGKGGYGGKGGQGAPGCIIFFYNETETGIIRIRDNGKNVEKITFSLNGETWDYGEGEHNYVRYDKNNYHVMDMRRIEHGTYTVTLTNESGETMTTICEVDSENWSHYIDASFSS